MIKEGILEHSDGRRKNGKSENMVTQSGYSFPYELYKLYFMIEIKIIMSSSTKEGREDKCFKGK